MLSLLLAMALADEPVSTEAIAPPPPISAWFRIDTDGLGTQLWVGATHRAGPLAIASDVYVAGTFAELDVGLAFSTGPVSLTPMLGIGFDFDPSVQQATVLVPQLFTVVSGGPVYVESWLQAFLGSPFGGGDTFYARQFALLAAGKHLQLGPQVEVTAGLGEGAKLQSLPVGGRANLVYGTKNTLGLFLGYDTTASGTGAAAGRATFVRMF